MNKKNLIKRALSARRVVVKVGTSSLTHPSGLINLTRVEKLIRQLADLKNRGCEVILVSSGAIGAGMGRLKIDKSEVDIAQKQALAAIGQNILMHIYLKLAAEYGYDVGQILLTQEDLADAKRSGRSKDALLALLDWGVMPIINENDAVAVEEIKFGDNDRLSAMVAKLIAADLLIILSDIDGLYDANPQVHPDAKLIDYVAQITPQMKSAAQSGHSTLGTGGMATKLMAVEIAQTAEIPTIIANSSTPDVLSRLLDGDNLGTYFAI